MTDISRRKLLLQLAQLALLAGLPRPLLAEILSKDPQPSGFGSDSTAEQVTEGLDLSGRTYAITGANSGLGLETMRVLAMRGAHVIGIARTQEKAENACASIDGRTTPMFLDLADFASVVSCADGIRALEIPIDGLVCNAGIMALQELELVNGVERQFAVNHLGHFILINQLLETVQAAEQGRFVILSSGAHESAPDFGIQFDDLGWQNTEYHPWTAYGHSKLANALCSRELARRLSGSTTTSNSLHPGVIATNLGRHLPWYMKLGGALFGWAFMKDVHEGAATQTYVAANPAVSGVNGYYWADCNVAEGSKWITDDAMAARLWEVSEELTRNYLPVPTRRA
jgi:NAD(P)-dependent dehydrogenase (short-subunit alcohol dehydrogenase family)